MLIDDVTIEVTAGRGGNGIVAWNKNMLSLGPTGGSGGQGGNVYVEGVNNIGALHHYRSKKVFSAPHGQDGGQQRRTGYDGKPLILPVPVGTVVHNLISGKDTDITKIGQKELVAKGGNGGRGNYSYRSSRNTSPDRADEGVPGEQAQLRLELKLIADVGFVGFPNVGKSSLLNELTRAQSKVANYAFTTLEPHLGVYYELILADIPGIIEGASSGKGLGIKFLQHIERTKVLFHFVSAESDDVIADYEAIRKELEMHNPELLTKEEYIFLSKSDTISPKEVDEKLQKLQRENTQVWALTILDDESIKQVKTILNKVQEDKQETV